MTEEEIIKMTNRYIARTLDNIAPISIAQQNEVKRQFRFFQQDILSKTQENKKTGATNGKEKR